MSRHTQPQHNVPDPAVVHAHLESLSPPDLYTFPFHIARHEDPWSELKPFLDRWFKDGDIVTFVGLTAMYGWGADKCTAACDGETTGFLYAGMAYHAAAAERAAAELAAEEAEPTVKKTRKRKARSKTKKTEGAAMDPEASPPHPLPRIADIQALHQSSVGHDLYTFPLVVRSTDPVTELAMWFDVRRKILIDLTHSMAHGTRPAETCTARCDANSTRYLDAGMAYHIAAAERAAAELAADGPDGDETKGRKRNRKKGKHKSKARGDGTDGDTEPPITEADNTGADATPTSYDDGNAEGSEDEHTIDDNDQDSSDQIFQRKGASAKLNSLTDGSTRTCFCETCVNPPGRLARLDDSDLEDWVDEGELAAVLFLYNPPDNHSFFFDRSLVPFFEKTLNAEEQDGPAPSRYCTPDCIITLNGQPAPRHYMCLWDSQQGLLIAALAFHSAVAHRYSVGPSVVLAAATVTAVRVGLNERWIRRMRVVAPHLLVTFKTDDATTLLLPKVEDMHSSNSPFASDNISSSSLASSLGTADVSVRVSDMNGQSINADAATPASTGNSIPGGQIEVSMTIFRSPKSSAPAAQGIDDSNVHDHQTALVQTPGEEPVAQPVEPSATALAAVLDETTPTKLATPKKKRVRRKASTAPVGLAPPPVPQPSTEEVEDVADVPPTEEKLAKLAEAYAAKSIDELVAEIEAAGEPSPVKKKPKVRKGSTRPGDLVGAGLPNVRAAKTADALPALPPTGEPTAGRLSHVNTKPTEDETATASATIPAVRPVVSEEHAATPPVTPKKFNLRKGSTVPAAMATELGEPNVPTLNPNTTAGDMNSMNNGEKASRLVPPALEETTSSSSSSAASSRPQTPVGISIAINAVTPAAPETPKKRRVRRKGSTAPTEPAAEDSTSVHDGSPLPSIDVAPTEEEMARLVDEYAAKSLDELVAEIEAVGALPKKKPKRRKGSTVPETVMCRAATAATASTSTGVSAAETRRMPQTCYCKSCENPPARWKRIDDTESERSEHSE
ncbi:uncharacterized protein LOC62_07G009469 [Vanrija pseudolonga]|uniref:Uncharacterized protein n=1 Tax=Vanrija pseudolonga TaxID=143232 RepID=A0AAF0YKE7_9TREE|nr:hypothetical protein LOC62_07G009469 [Vanrija pseudolonga]